MSSLVVVEENLTRYGMSTYLVLGTVGNLLNIVIFCQRSHRNNSCSLYLLVVSILNIFILNFGVIPTIYSLYYINPETYSIAYCKLRLYLLHSALMISRSMIILACIDRYAICTTSKSTHPFCKRKVAIYLVILIVLSWPIIALHIPILLTIKSQQCGAYGNYTLVYSIYSLIVAGLLPPTLMIIFGLLTVRNLRGVHARIQPSMTRISHTHKKDHYLVVMLISEIIVYLISTIPYPMHTLYMTITRDMMKSSSRIQIESFMTFLVHSFFIYINSASTFYVYICTSHAYRYQCRQLFVRCWMQMTKSAVDDAINQRRYAPSRQYQITTV